MAAIERNWKTKLVGRYPDLFRPPHGMLEVTEGALECGEGWWSILDTACIRIRAALAIGLGTFRFTQIKEKAGTLRIYWAGRLSGSTEERIREAIDLAEARSACCCELCGHEGHLFRNEGILTTRCLAHSGGVRVEARDGFANIHLVQRVVGHRRTVQCCRYDQRTDSFVVVDLAVTGSED